MNHPGRVFVWGTLAFAGACEDEPRPAPTVQICQPGGTFEMGTTALDPCGRFTDSLAVCRTPESSERAWHPVFLTPYYLDRTEVTNAQYRECVEHGPCTKQSRKDAGDPEQGSWQRFYADGDRWRSHPVVNVTHAQAATYCAWRGGRLPTEAEWEMAARGPGGRADQDWPWGEAPDPLSACRDDPDAIAFGRCAGGFPWKVGTAALDRRGGVHDLMGNVSEWVLDAWDPLAYCAEEARALYRPPTGSGLDAAYEPPGVLDPAALDAMCAGSTDCLASCDAERFWCLAGCEECKARAGDSYLACQDETFCLQACRVPTDCDCALAAEMRPAGCNEACECLPGSRATPFPAAESPETCIAHCFETADARCRESGCLKSECRTYCGEVLRESNRLCPVRGSMEGRPVEVPVVLEAPEGLETFHVAKGADYLTPEAASCELRVSRRVPREGDAANIGFRCAFDAEPGQTGCAE